MIEMKTIRIYLQSIKYYYADQALRGRVYPNITFKGYPEDIVKIVKKYEMIIDKAPICLRLAYTGLYRCLKTQKKYAEERGVTEKYIQILHKRIIVYLYKHLNINDAHCK